MKRPPAKSTAATRAIVLVVVSVAIVSFYMVFSISSDGASDIALNSGQKVSLKEGPARLLVASSLLGFFEQEKSNLEQELGRKLVIVGGASSSLSRQVERGLDADALVVADPKWLTTLQSAGKLSRKSVLFRDSLSLVAPSGTKGDSFLESVKNESPESFAKAFLGFDGQKKIALGETKTVPVGAYAKLLFKDSFEQLTPHLVFANSASAVLRLVELGSVSLGVVYSAQAKQSEDVSVLKTFDSLEHPKIEYWISEIEGNRVEAASACANCSFIYDKVKTSKFKKSARQFGYQP